MTYVSKPFYFISMIVVSLIGNIFLAIEISLYGYKGLPGPAFILCYIPILYASCITMVFYYKMWKALPPNVARTTPGKAVGFLFIPIFQFYWMFQVLWGWSKDFNRFASEQKLDVPKAPEKLALVVNILSVAGLVLVIILMILHMSQFGIWLGVINTGFFSVFLWQAITALNALPLEIRQRVREERDALEIARGPVASKQGFAVTSMVTGIFSILLPYLGLLLGIVAILCARAQKKYGRSKLATIGRVCGIIGTSLWGTFILILLLIITGVIFKAK